MQRQLPLDDYDFYLCGPPPFIHATYQTLRGFGVAKDRIAHEFFGPATALDTEVKLMPVAPTAGAIPAVGAITVEFRKSGIVAEWNACAQPLLYFAEALGLTPEFSCRAVICGTCVSQIVSGEVSYFEDPLEELAQGKLLLCCTRPETPVALDL